MKTSLKVEELAIFILCVIFFMQLNFVWWWFPILLFIPDISMLGYIISNKAGALLYNIAHHRLLATCTAVYAVYTGNEFWQLAAIILFAHISLDRALGYGLKYTDSFNHTHLGFISKNQPNNTLK